MQLASYVRYVLFEPVGWPFDPESQVGKGAGVELPRWDLPITPTALSVDTMHFYCVLFFKFYVVFFFFVPE